MSTDGDERGGAAEGPQERVRGLSPGGALNGPVRLPASKSLAQRYLMCAALCSEPTDLRGLGYAQDTRALLAALDTLGVEAAHASTGGARPGSFRITGRAPGPQRGLRMPGPSDVANTRDREAPPDTPFVGPGASSVSELSVLGRPSILVPLPGAIDQDQASNAKVLEKVGGAWPIRQLDVTPARLVQEISRFIAEPQLLAEAALNARRVAKPDAVIRLANLVEEIAERKGERP